MTGEEILDRLVDLARDAGLRVQLLRGGPATAGGPAPESAVCRVYGEVRIVLAEVDPIERRIDLVAGALRERAPRLLEERFLPPAVRARLEAEEGGVASEPARGAAGPGGAPDPEA